MNNNNIVNTQIENNEKKVPWNKAHLTHKKKSLSIKLILVAIIIIGFILSFVLTKIYSEMRLKEQPIAIESDTKEIDWLKRKLNLANLPYTSDYIQDKDNPSDFSISESNQNQDSSANTLPQSMLIEHEPEKYVDIILEKNKISN